MEKLTTRTEYDEVKAKVESQFSQIMSGRRRISMSFAKRLHSKLGINADLILEYA